MNNDTRYVFILLSFRYNTVMPVSISQLKNYVPARLPTPQSALRWIRRTFPYVVFPGVGSYMYLTVVKLRDTRKITRIN